MKTMKNAAFLAFFGLFLSQCAIDPKKLDGAWRASDFSKKGEPQAVALDEIRLVFEAEKGEYSFSSLFRYREAGHFRASSGVIFLTDTTARPAVERKIEVKKATENELWLEPRAGEFLKMRRDSTAKK